MLLTKILDRLKHSRLRALLWRKTPKLQDMCDTLSYAGPERETAVLLFVHFWKRDFIADYFPEYNLLYLNNRRYQRRILAWLVKQDIPLIIWGYRDYHKFRDLFESCPNVIRVEDGFLRSIGLGKNKTTPLSLAIDHRGLYYNATRESDLEHLLNHHEFRASELEKAKKAMTLIKKHGISKYNHAPKIRLDHQQNTRHRILVIGQVENDASIKFGCKQACTNRDLVRLAQRENPGAEIIFKVHPDILSKQVPGSSLAEIFGNCTIISDNIAPCSLFEVVDKVYTITSLMGFEALLYGLPVVCVGAPFYSNWGLTDDRQIVDRRIRQRSLLEVFCAAYVLYPRYPYGDILSIIPRLGAYTPRETVGTIPELV